MSDIVTLELRHPAGTTPVVVGRGALVASMPGLCEWVENRTLFLISSPPVLGLHGGALARLKSSAARCVVLEVPDGEEAKSLAQARSLWERMLQEGGKRDSRVVTFGGGSVGDLGGFVAGCFLRGVEWVQLPTTLLAQVDAAIGGKTAVDLPAAKNSVGLFYHPQLVVSETSVLGTLPAAELRSGLVEVIKMAVLLDPDLLQRVETGIEGLLAGSPEVMAPVVAAAAAAKIGVVERDPDDQGERKLLNFGHTLGHALETALAYRQLRHGEAVGYGILFATRLAEKRGFAADEARRLRSLVGRLGLPPLPPVGVDELLQTMARDKKSSEAGLSWVLPEKVGQGGLASDVGEEELRVELESFLAALCQK